MSEVLIATRWQENGDGGGLTWKKKAINSTNERANEQTNKQASTKKTQHTHTHAPTHTANKVVCGGKESQNGIHKKENKKEDKQDHTRREKKKKRMLEA
mmetsp:Transcript_39809/g.77389  ORF Transcript_39809/g.77389 Transcript_39809/m.77389 type:complete len:99 (-) Transcript_39809:277-573(-)